MVNGKKLTVVLPAYNAGKTLEKTYNEIPFDIVDEVILIDDCSKDNTREVARRLGIKHIVVHDQNKGNGGNQKCCYNKALGLGDDIVIMLPPDYQHTPKLIHSMVYLIANRVYEMVRGARIVGRGAIKGGIPRYKYIFKRLLTLFQNNLMRQKLSKYHTAYRALSRKVIESIDYIASSVYLIFYNKMLAQILYKSFEIAEITCPTKYFDEASSIYFRRNVKYRLKVKSKQLNVFWQKQVYKDKIFK